MGYPFLGFKIPVDFWKNPEKSRYRKTRLSRMGSSNGPFSRYLLVTFLTYTTV